MQYDKPGNLEKRNAGLGSNLRKLRLYTFGYYSVFLGLSW